MSYTDKVVSQARTTRTPVKRRTLPTAGLVAAGSASIIYSPMIVRSVIPSQDIIKAQFHALAERLCEDHPAISTDAEVVGGRPHIKGTRLSVGTILAKLYLYGSIQAVVKIHEPHLSEAQVKDAIAYAQDFLEIACDPHEAP